MNLYKRNRSTVLFFAQLTMFIMSLGVILALVLTLTKDLQ